MASMTDYVVEGLKYPFNDVKKLLSFGAILAVLNLISIAISTKGFGIFRVFVREVEKPDVSPFSVKFTQLPANDIYLVIALAIIAFVIMLIVMGYQYNVVKFSIDKKECLPDFREISSILVNGAKFIAVGIAYNIVPTIVLMAGILIGNSSIFFVITFIAFILYLAAFFFMIMALNNMIANDSVKKAFDFKQIAGKIANIGWGKYVGILIFTIIIFMIVSVSAGFILGFVTILFTMAFNQAIIVSAFIGILEGLFITSYTSVFFNRVCGSVYRESVK